MSYDWEHWHQNRWDAVFRGHPDDFGNRIIYSWAAWQAAWHFFMSDLDVDV